VISENVMLLANASSSTDGQCSISLEPLGNLPTNLKSRRCKSIMSTVGQTEDETGADDVRQLVMFNSLTRL
jgi:hypothetical protein